MPPAIPLQYAPQPFLDAYVLINIYGSFCIISLLLHRLIFSIHHNNSSLASTPNIIFHK